jgi:hypothetical protein
MYDKHRSLAIFIIAILIILLCGGTGLMSYSRGKDTGYNNGYKAGQDYSYSQGYDKGKEEGYKVGYDAGFEAAYSPKPVESTDSYTLRNPTYQEMKDFLNKDTANLKTYIEGKYTCTDFAAEVNNNAEDQGIRCAVVYIVYPDTGHSIAAFETTDNGLIFIEPQFDKEVTLTIGESYSKLNGYRQQEPVDDTIQRYQVMW